MKRITELSDNTTAFASTVDAIFFLVLVSVAAVILMPSITADGQYDAARYTATQDFETHLLETLLNGKIDDFGYTLSPTTIINLSMPNSSIATDATDAVLGKHQHHRTLSDLIAEDMLLGLSVVGNNSYTPINPMAEEHGTQTRDAIRSYLDSTIGRRYDYRFETRWVPFNGFPLESRIVVGNVPLPDAIRQSAMITLPLAHRVSRDAILGPINDTVLADMNTSLPAMRSTAYHAAFNQSITVASHDASLMITELVFPADHLRSLLRSGSHTSNEQRGLMGDPQTINCTPDLMMATQLIEHMTTALNLTNLTVSTKLSSSAVTQIEDEMVLMNQRQIMTSMNEELSGGINATVALMVNSSGPEQTTALRDKQVDSIYRTVNTAGVDVVLSLW
ncbi:MAG: hypothetical protein K8R64_04100 [Methanosarcinaceae archaeon]|nr:hypothetical protein [Methanosarcinaceae archaeon]